MDTTKHRKKRVCVIGAGPSGIACARWCIHEGVKPIVFEQTGTDQS
jgi:flavin-dependent dehydrogenase